MNKDAYYFPHFSNARGDRKIKRVRKELGPEGYAIYFMLLEVLRDQDGFRYPLQDIDLLADDFGTSEQKVNTVISNYKLFSLDENESFFSFKFNEYMQPYLDKKERARAAAMKRWHGNANALPEHSASNASKVKKRREEESKQSREEDPAIEAVAKFETNRKTWNATAGLPEYRRLQTNIDLGLWREMLNVLPLFTSDEIRDAIANYARLLEAGRVSMPYRSYPNFIKKGLEKFNSDADPDTLYPEDEKDADMRRAEAAYREEMGEA